MSYLITQTEADYFFQIEKIPEDDAKYTFPVSGDKLVIPFTSLDKRESFLFDITRSIIKIRKVTYQSRVRKIYILRRLDIDGPAHLNPEINEVPLEILKPYNGQEIECPHLHIYIEDFNNKWAVPADLFFNFKGKDIYDIMIEFFTYCNAKKLPEIEKRLLL
ncbi:MAG: hypothetical protein NTX22_12365 [Ignavibacteriales bacterium]|nr:hypothetical protein [Ignavibacteriales bacterium]